ncbi:unnamed protein product [Gordionus sp. m RMFG-2023]
MSTFNHFATHAIHSGQKPEDWNFLPLVPPISLATTFKQKSPGQPEKYDYSRSGNPSREVLETCLASLEDAKFALTYSSGLSALNNIISLLKSGDHILCVDDVYGGTFRYLDKVATKFRISTTFIDATDLQKVDDALKSNPKMIWIETPTNPTLKIIDIAEISKKCKEIKPTKPIVVVDNTFLTPYFQRPLNLGADIVTHSLTKYMNGHTDVVMGSICVNDDTLYKELKFLQNAIGGVPSPFDCFLVNRGIKTLHVRMKEHFSNGLKIAQYLENHAGVEKVLHPWLPSHPHYELAIKQTKGHSGMITFYIKGNLEQAKIFLQNLKIFALAESLGGYESLAEHPALMTHASIPKLKREAIGITDNLVRLSVGIEDYQDLINDIDQALKIALNM